jgi:hypothetical protein
LAHIGYLCGANKGAAASTFVERVFGGPHFMDGIAFAESDYEGAGSNGGE